MNWPVRPSANQNHSTRTLVIRNDRFYRLSIGCTQTVQFSGPCTNPIRGENRLQGGSVSFLSVLVKYSLRLVQRSNFTATQIAFRWPGRCESTRKTDSDSRGQSGWASIAGHGRRTSMSAEEHLCNTANETTATCFLGGSDVSLH